MTKRLRGGRGIVALNETGKGTGRAGGQAQQRKRLTEIRADDAAALEERKALDTALATIDGRIIEAKARESEDEEQHRLDHPQQATNGLRGEAAEFRQLVDSASVGRIIGEIAAGRGVRSGAEAEIQEHYGMDDNFVPLRLLMGDPGGHRAAASYQANAATEGTTPGMAGQVFGDSLASYINARIADTPVGTRVIPVITTGSLGNVSAPAKGGEVAETDSVLSIKELRPARLQCQFSYAMEDARTYSDWDAGLSRNLREGVRDKINDQLLNATDKGLLTSGHSAAPGQRRPWPPQLPTWPRSSPTDAMRPLRTMYAWWLVAEPPGSIST